MATLTRASALYAEIASKHGLEVAEAFYEAINRIRSAVQIQRLTALIEQGRIEDALEALQIEESLFNDLADKARAAHVSAGHATADTLPRRRPDGTAVVVRFDGRNPAAEAWINEHSSQLITHLTDETKQAVRVSLTVSMEAGVNPRQAALEVVGRINKATGKREGGVLGLSVPQAEYVAKARAELLSGDPEDLKHYLTRQRRDKRFDRSITKAIRTGEPVPAETIAKAITAYEGRLLKLRGEIIARVETMTAIQQGKYEAFRQAIADGKVDVEAVTKIWRSAGDMRVRHTHMALNGKSVGFNEPFRSPSGALLRYPMDTGLGAGTDEIVGCRCDCEYKIDFYRNLE